MTPSFWTDREVLLTGHTGFKGAWLALWLQGLGARVTGFALPPPTQPNLFEHAQVEQGMTSVLGDVGDLAALTQAMHAAQPEVLFHLAAQALVRPSYVTPVETFATNVLGTVHLLEAARRVDSVRAIVVVTSDKCYENRGASRAFSEEDPLGGHDPYSASKACAELATTAYQRSFLAERGVGVATARAGNVIGGGDWARDRIIPDAVRAVQRGEPLQVRHPQAVRPWQHVLEPLAGYLLLAERLHEQPETFSGPWNFGPASADCLTVSALLDQFFECWGEGAWQPHVEAQRVHEAHLLRLDARKARRQLGWRPRLPLAEAIQLTARWYREALAGAPPNDLHALTVEQIHIVTKNLERGTGNRMPLPGSPFPVPSSPFIP